MLWLVVLWTLKQMPSKIPKKLSLTQITQNQSRKTRRFLFKLFNFDNYCIVINVQNQKMCNNLQITYRFVVQTRNSGSSTKEMSIYLEILNENFLKVTLDMNERTKLERSFPKILCPIASLTYLVLLVWAATVNNHRIKSNFFSSRNAFSCIVQCNE